MYISWNSIHNIVRNLMRKYQRRSLQMQSQRTAAQCGTGNASNERRTRPACAEKDNTTPAGVVS